MAPGLLDSELLGFQALERVMRAARTWDSIISLLPKGGEAIWGGLDWSPEEDYDCDASKKRYTQSSAEVNSNNTDGKRGFKVKESVKYGRMISFGKAASQIPSSQFPNLGSTDIPQSGTASYANMSCGEAMTEYDYMERESIHKVAENKAYTAKSLIDLFRSVAPKMMQRAEAHFSHGVAEDLDDPKYAHYKYWSNPLETKLPDAPEMEIFCSYGVGVPTERSYVYKMSPSGKCKSIPFRIDSSAYDNDGGCLNGGVYFVDGDESVTVMSAGFMCAKGWRGRTRFNPSGISTYVREFKHKAPASLLEGRGLESGSHVDILGNFGLIEDVLRVAAGATGADIGGDRIYSDIKQMSDRVNIRL